MRAAVSDTAGSGVLYVPDTGRGTEAVASMAAEVGSAVPVATTTIDHIAPPDVSLIKLDVEGMEAAALRGAASVLSERSPVLLVELEYRRSPVDEVVDLLADHGYTAEILEDGRWRPSRASTSPRTRTACAPSSTAAATSARSSRAARTTSTTCCSVSRASTRPSRSPGPGCSARDRTTASPG
ncbi:FkbM family methyltransferase [Actinokineospora soli]|uniref:FkbM family methyltransferase n=1 Tax=Actinokineospora soli TaxID=1048753 RepID=A0ABW2TI97_9PSEU